MIPLCDWYHPVSKSLCSLYLCLSDCCKKKHFHQYINLSLYIPRKTIKHDNCIHPLFKVVSTFNLQPKLIIVAIATTGKISRAGVNYFTLNVKYTSRNLNGKYAYILKAKQFAESIFQSQKDLRKKCVNLDKKILQQSA